MKVSVDISLYPLKEEYIPPIDDFIARLDASPHVKLIKNNLSTQIFGDYDEVMHLLKNEIRRSFETHGKSIFVTKFLMNDLS